MLPVSVIDAPDRRLDAGQGAGADVGLAAGRMLVAAGAELLQAATSASGARVAAAYAARS